MNLFRTCLLLLGLCGSAAWSESSGSRPAGAGDKAAPGKEVAKKRKPKFTVSKETTYVTGPLRKDGTIDYAAALNERLSRGVTVDNNANVLLWKAFGPHPENATMPPEFFKLLGYQPPERGDYFRTDLYSYLRKHFKGDPDKQLKAVDTLFDRVTERPWTAKQYPQVAAWLKANAKPLAVVVEGTKRSHYFSPLTSKGDSGLIGALVPGVQKCREFANALSVRAMLHIGEGRYDEAWQDLLACHRLGRLISKGGTLIELLVGIAVDRIASSGDLAYLEHAKLSAKQVTDRLADLQRLPPLSLLAEQIDLGERFMFLDIVMMVARDGLRALEGLGGGRPAKASDPLADWFLKGTNWDPALRNANRWYDRLVRTLRRKDRAARQKELDQFVIDIKLLKVKIADPEKRLKAALRAGASPEARGEAIGDILICLLVPAVHKVQLAMDRSEQTERNLRVAFALAANKADHGRYPKKLEALAPKYLPQVPGDLFSGKPLIYQPSEKGYLLYSVGINGEDEQGRSEEDDPPGDDLTVRMPLPALRRR